MSLNSVILAVEDSLSDVVSTKILKHFGIENLLRIPNTYKGKSYLQRRAATNSTDQRRDRFMCLCSQT